MRSVSASMQAKLDAAVSTFCNCWRLARRDGTIMGFTDHDRDLAFNGVIFRAGSGLAATQVESGVGFAAGTSEALGALQADSLTESDLLDGLYDGASVEVWLVDWSAVEDRVLLNIATIGEVKRSEFAFSAELRSSAHLFDQQRGGSFQRACSADLGDERCRFDLSTQGFSTTGSVSSSAGSSMVAALAGVFDANFFTGGRMTFASGANAGGRVTIKSHTQSGTSANFAFWTPLAHPLAAGDAFAVVAGCDKSPATCQQKFANFLNFRGVPHMPGNDRVIAYPSTLAPTMDGGSLFR
ncbi:MAG: DUF2163 domain-containing protein [Methylocystis sp.]|nr:DUF2163 domain-containing protein [Methylocystis sp.]